MSAAVRYWSEGLSLQFTAAVQFATKIGQVISPENVIVLSYTIIGIENTSQDLVRHATNNHGQRVWAHIEEFLDNRDLPQDLLALKSPIGALASAKGKETLE